MVQGFYFALLKYSHIQAFTVRFVRSMQLYRQLYPLNRPRYQTDKSGYNAACATLERITALQHLQRIPDTRRRAGRYTGQRSRPIIIRYIRAHRCAPVVDSCPAVQHSADHASGGGSVHPACIRCRGHPSGWRSGTGQQLGRTGPARHPPPGGAVQQQGRGGRRGTIGGLSPHLFSGFRPMPIEVSNSRSVPAGIVVADSRSFSRRIVVE